MTGEEAGSESYSEESRNPFQLGRFVQWWLAYLVAATGIGIQAVTVPLFIRDRVEADNGLLRSRRP